MKIASAGSTAWSPTPFRSWRPDTGYYNFFLNAQGRIQGDGYIFAYPDELLIETARQQVAALIPYLDHFIIMDDVELADINVNLVTESPSSAPPQPHCSTNSACRSKTSATSKPAASRGTPLDVTVIHTHSPLVPRFELWVNTPQARRTAPRVPCKPPVRFYAMPTALESLRILEGTPLYGTDIRDRDLPQETNQTRALHFAKGCYLGQEIVERIRSRGNVHRTFTAFRLEGALPASGTPIEVRRQAGRRTHQRRRNPTSKSGALQLALGYVRREALDRGESAPIRRRNGNHRHSLYRGQNSAL